MINSIVCGCIIIYVLMTDLLGTFVLFDVHLTLIILNEVERSCDFTALHNLWQVIIHVCKSSHVELIKVIYLAYCKRL